MMEDLINSLSPVKDLDKVAVFMTSGFGYSTPSGVHFTKEQPYQMVPGIEIGSLLDTGRFQIATVTEVKEFYGL